MEFKEVKDFRKEGVHRKKFESNGPLHIQTIINIIKNYENETTKFYRCRIDTFTEEGNVMHRTYYKLSELDEMLTLPNPSIGLDVVYINPQTDKYKFDIGTYANTNSLIYSEDQEYADNINREIELKKMADQKSAEEKKSNEETWTK